MRTRTEAKQLRPAYEDKRAIPPRRVPYAGHGRVICGCGAVLASCDHDGHQGVIATLSHACGQCGPGAREVKGTA